jgi:excinuclease ABC subunit C
MPGVYLFLGKKGKVLYVGRATSLKRRVSNYFQKPQDPRLSEMLNIARKIKYFKTDNVLEAIILEANLIKKYWPKYNIKEKDNRSFIYIVIPKTEWPRPFIVRQRELQKFLSAAIIVKSTKTKSANNKTTKPKFADVGSTCSKFLLQRKFATKTAEVFGPYQSVHLIKTGLRLIRKIFPYSTCKIGGGKPCFDYQIGLCPGACVGAISKKDYQKNIDNLILFLRGEKKKLLAKLKKENPEKISALKHIQDVALIKDEIGNWNLEIGNYAQRIEGYDISHLAGKETYGSMAVFVNGVPDKNQYRLFKIKEAPANDDLRALEEIITRRLRHAEWRYPDLILIDGGKPQISFISKTLKKQNINIPLVGISKFGDDKLVFPPKIKSSSKELIRSMKNTLLKIREEAHRFAIKASRRRRKKLIK